jgi:Na+-transporting methylmalonyl-CoA/oxaloacetate decarboxylase gamma subunit
MSLTEAGIVTVLGMSVVFAGLVLCIAFIQVFNRLARHVAWGHGGHGAPAAAPAPATAPQTQPGEVVDPEVLAVIATVVEIESALYLGRHDAKLTLRRHGPQP